MYHLEPLHSFKLLTITMASENSTRALCQDPCGPLAAVLSVTSYCTVFGTDTATLTVIFCTCTLFGVITQVTCTISVYPVCLSLFSYMLSIVSMAESIDGHLPFLAACHCTYYSIAIVCFLLGK